jgi:hypothetical protein
MVTQLEQASGEIPFDRRDKRLDPPDVGLDVVYSMSSSSHGVTSSWRL